MEPQAPPAKTASTERVSTKSSTPSAVEPASAAAGASVVQPTPRQTDVTFRRDNNGRIYYVVADAKSGQEILEIPPKAVRDVGQGIEDYLKQIEAKAGPHVEVKA